MSTPVIVGIHDPNTIDQINQAAQHPNVRAAALLPDGHYGYGVPIGGVIAYEDAISPSGVGFDIGCGVIAIQTDLRISDIRDDLPRIADAIHSQIEFGMGRTTDLGYEHPIMEDFRWTQVPKEVKDLRKLANDQLGTVGAGNHYVDLLVDSARMVWIACHFGSRGFGHKTATHYFNQLGGEGRMSDPPKVLVKQDQPSLFDEYVIAMTLAGDYARAGREIVAYRVLDILEAKELDVVHNHHNYAWYEDGLWVVRKGATPAAVGERGFVGGSMNDLCAIVSGTPESKRLLTSTVHGAGRVMSRTAAAGKYKRGADGKKRRTQGAVTPAIWESSTAAIELRGGGYDEAPMVYRDLADVLNQLGDMVRVETAMHPVVVCMAGADTYDAFKD